LKNNRVFIEHILAEINYLLKESKNLKYEDLIEDETLKRAFVRSLEVIGEATKNLSAEFRDKYPEIKWREIAGLRDKLIHHYFGVNLKRVWDVIENKIPELKKQIEKILENVDYN
jgi:uncharacterized protein with HEPN domain